MSEGCKKPLARYMIYAKPTKCSVLSGGDDVAGGGGGVRKGGGGGESRGGIAGPPRGQSINVIKARAKKIMARSL